MLDGHRTDNAIKNHWNSTMRRKYEANKQLKDVMNSLSTACSMPLLKLNYKSAAINLHRPTEPRESLPLPTFV